ncbi:hypothetical protein nbrc107696_13740 [Gordonia spumicola]|uniref:Uncharacterized protein n=1 Tax=Gordonia spumicola TaxID=589161 RepID=A0A7I9V6D4_9ACTN|nr:hypothetical protein [Gordonia spumicola]GEE00928.1 hypothetical protein nbrc107696_13740 [Gordonia spumicola]
MNRFKADLYSHREGFPVEMTIASVGPDSVGCNGRYGAIEIVVSATLGDEETGRYEVTVNWEQWQDFENAAGYEFEVLKESFEAAVNALHPTVASLRPGVQLAHASGVSLDFGDADPVSIVPGWLTYIRDLSGRLGSGDDLSGKIVRRPMADGIVLEFSGDWTTFAPEDSDAVSRGLR